MVGFRLVRGGALLGLTALAGCAWSNEDNRPVWNAFEGSLVPSSEGLFYAALPVTVPLGLGAIAVDMFIAHPLQVVDDAYDDAAKLWDADGFAFAEAYYTEMARLPIRVVATPVAFGGSFLARVLFDVSAPVSAVDAPEDQAAVAQRRAKRAERRRARLLAWLAEDPDGRCVSIEAWHPSLDEPMRRALAGDARVRLRLHDGMLRAGMTKIGGYDATVGLRDPDPVVRYTCIKLWPRSQPQPPAELVDALRNDPVDSVRLKAVDRFGRLR